MTPMRRERSRTQRAAMWAMLTACLAGAAHASAAEPMPFRVLMLNDGMPLVGLDVVTMGSNAERKPTSAAGEVSYTPSANDLNRRFTVWTQSCGTTAAPARIYLGRGNPPETPECRNRRLGAFVFREGLTKVTVDIGTARIATEPVYAAITPKPFVGLGVTYSSFNGPGHAAKTLAADYTRSGYQTSTTSTDSLGTGLSVFGGIDVDRAFLNKAGGLRVSLDYTVRQRESLSSEGSRTQGTTRADFSVTSRISFNALSLGAGPTFEFGDKYKVFGQLNLARWKASGAADGVLKVNGQSVATDNDVIASSGVSAGFAIGGSYRVSGCTSVQWSATMRPYRDVVDVPNAGRWDANHDAVSYTVGVVRFF